ncbi:hypothetical protein CIK05_12915 [Bdellovibrio sp. qaytius]|nr:hypothetical protein CIK05_12915 [Bdellovibrio sp. qaytius]
MKKILLISSLLVGSLNVSAASMSEIMPPIPAGSNPEQIWANYCVGKRNSADIPMPNYKNKDVINAVKVLAKVSPYSFYFYSGPLYTYNLKNGKDLVDVPAEFPADIQEVKNGRKNANAFMTLLCGEFRDRPTLIKEKIRWVNRMYTLPTTPQKTINIRNELWSQVSANSYGNYIRNSRAIFAAKEYEARKYEVKLGQYNEDVPVDPFTICETKFIFKKYVETNTGFEHSDREFAAYKKEFNKFKARCSQEDLDYIYDFRGDSNFKPNSPESNGMIWYSSTITNNCTRNKDGQYVLKAAAVGKVTDPDICQKYASAPFAYRWTAARAGLATWMLRDQKHDEVFSTEDQPVYIVPNLDPMAGPFAFKMPVKGEFYEEELYKNDKGEFIQWDNVTGEEKVMTNEEVTAHQAKQAQLKAEFDAKVAGSNGLHMEFVKTWESQRDVFWKRPDLGFNSLTGLGSKTTDKGFAYERIRDAVNRHTDWYASGYDDGSEKLRDQAYSPFVASSYEMSASDGFTSPGVTVNSPADGCKHWMFVFKLKKDQWYNTHSVQNKVPVNFNYHWFDETSFGTNHLADSEHAFDRLGTALEGEMDVILYLHKLDTAGRVNEECGYEQMGLPVEAVGKN